MLLNPKNWPTACICLLAWLTVRFPPHQWLLIMGAWLGRLLAWLRPDRRLVAQANLRACMPELSDQQHQALVRDTIEATGIGLVESAMALWCTNRQISKRFNVQGLEHLDQALVRGKGAIVLGAHFTTGELSARLFASSVPTPVQMLARRNNQPWLERVIDRGRKRHCQGTLDKKNLGGLLRVLRKNGTVVLASDQDFSYQSVFAPFFGVPAATVTSIAAIAQRTGATVVPIWCQRLENGNYQLKLEAPWQGFPVEDELANASRMNTWIESRVRTCPAQYLWVHRRFKTRPPGVPPFYPVDARRQKDR
jgi:KDO2-lipid IV(A) lauroyltransferase